jgi:hypothetical protein
MTYDIYATPNNAFIPDVEIKSVEDYADNQKRSVAFLWQGTKQWLELTIQDDGFYLITDTEYTDEFESWLDENLENYDSLESLFGMKFSTTKQVYFVVAVEIDANNNATITIDEDRADVLMGEDAVWDTDNAEWSPISDNEEIFEQATKILKDKLGA